MGWAQAGAWGRGPLVGLEQEVKKEERDDCLGSGLGLVRLEGPSPVISLENSFPVVEVGVIRVGPEVVGV